MKKANKITNSEFVVENVNGEAYKYYPLGDHIVRAVGVCGGRPTFKYTRIEVDFILAQLANGEQISELIDDYDHPHLTEEVVREALKLASFAFSSSPCPINTPATPTHLS